MEQPNIYCQYTWPIIKRKKKSTNIVPVQALFLMHVWYPGSSPALLPQNYIIFGKHNLFWDWDKTAVCYFDVDSWEGCTLLAAHSPSRGSHDNKDYHNIGMASSNGFFLFRIGRLVQLIQAGPSTTSSAANCSALDELSTVYFAWRTLYLSITTGKVRHEQHLYELLGDS